MTSWQLQEAKDRFCEVVERAIQGDAQIITRRGEEVAVIIGIDAYRRLTTPTPRLIDVLRNAPPGFDELEITRDQGPMREPFAL